MAIICQVLKKLHVYTGMRKEIYVPCNTVVQIYKKARDTRHSYSHGLQYQSGSHGLQQSSQHQDCFFFEMLQLTYYIYK